MDKLPVAFAQVREDPRLDVAVLRAATTRRGGARVLMVASGGCTAVTLLGRERIARLVAVDVNPAQLAVFQIKRRLLALPPPRRRQLLGHAALAPAVRLAELRGVAERGEAAVEQVGPADWVARRGLDFTGRYEELFRLLAHRLHAAGWLRPLLGAAPSGDRACLRPALQEIFADVFAQERLERLFGAAAAGNRRRPFAAHFLARLRVARRRAGWRGNPFLRGFLGQPCTPRAGLDWLELPPRQPQASVAAACAEVCAYLQATDETFDFIQLSNIADWLAPAEARRLLAATARRLAPGGRFILRQLNSALELPALGPALRWDAARSRALARADRSFFYPRVWTGGRR